ncbi:MAG: MmgE/PrpD family protein [Candidatus Alcyoniella australis]|nr:MmgE/PrpD family protein [Candidatus Alcyoniella australis]
MEYARKLAKFCTDLTFDQLPQPVVAKTRLCFLDFLANVYGSHELEAVRSVTDYVRSLDGPPQATALGCKLRTGAHQAALLNGVAAEAIEAQDGLRFGGNHPGVAVIPAALAVAEQRGCSGKELITAIVAGYEVAGRIAAAIHPFHTLGGFLPTGTCGTFGATAAAGMLMGLDNATLLNALGIAGYLLPLSMAETLMGGFTAKILQGGQAASVALSAAGLAAAGISGPPYVLEGSHLGGGFTKITTNSEPQMDRITEGLGESFSIMDIYFKPFTACRHTHGCAQAALELADQPGFAVERITTIEALTYGIAMIAVGKPVDASSTFVSAQFSIPYVVAACLLDRAMGPAQVREERISDPQLQSLAAKVRVSIDPELNDRYPEYTASRVQITMDDGELRSKQIDIPKGDPRDPLSADDLAAKLRAFGRSQDPATLDRICALTMGLDQLADVRQLTALA